MLYTLAYPQLGAEDRQFIKEFRERYDLPYRDVVEAHFTLLFGCDQVPVDSYEAHVAAVSDGASPIRFHCRYAMLSSGVDGDTNAYVFLVPDEGYAAMSLLHDGLYSGIMAPFLRLDVPFIPHINIGTLADRSEAKSLCDELNRGGVSVVGSIDRVSIGELRENKLHDVASFDL